MAHRWTLQPCNRGEGIGPLPLAQGSNEVGRATACALQPRGKSDANRVPAVARGFFGAHAISKQRGEQLVGLGGRDWCGLVGDEERSHLACTRLNREGKLEVNEQFRRIARHVDVGKGNACHPRLRPSHHTCSGAGRHLSAAERASSCRSGACFVETSLITQSNEARVSQAFRSGK
eukprot:6213428-Pleurochrysis_carterae.AAC.2